MDDKKEMRAIRMGRLLVKKLFGILNHREKAELDEWCQEYPENQQLYDKLPDKLAYKEYCAACEDSGVEESYQKFCERYYATHPKRNILLHPIYWWVGAAASILVIAFGLYFIDVSPKQAVRLIAQTKILPGYNQATLTLAGGTIITLDSAKTGIQISNEDIVYNDGNSVLPKKGRGPRAPGNNILSTPKGGQYQIILSDGTKIHLNAASTLKYPSRFSGDKREVILEGEAYFEVNNNSSIVNHKSNAPFIVHTNHQTVTVLGTEFIVAAYADEKEQTTTLVSGAVKVLGPRRAELILSPGEQSRFKDDQLTKVKADIKNEIAWTQGIFSFKKEPLESIMKKLARWYDVDVTFAKPALRQITFEGTLERSSSIHNVLRFIEQTGEAHFRIAGRRVSVY